MRDDSTWTMTMGANLDGDGARFSVWAPKARRIEVVTETGPEPGIAPLLRDEDGVFSGLLYGVQAGTRYRYRIDGGEAYPDPYSRYQPEGPHGPSELIDPAAFGWTDDAWTGLTADGLIIYELHVGAMTPAGTFDALRRQLPELRRLGVNAIELMPLADTPGRWNWGYDGVNLFAPNHHYGRPDDLKRLVNAAHEAGLGVIVDVVYNHLGPDGNYLRAFSDDYFTPRHQTPWGDGLNYDGANARFVRDFVIDNACYWLAEYHVDGLRLDAIDTIIDDSTPHVLAELSVRARAATPRDVVLIGEQASNEVRTIHPVGEGGLGLDAVWADDFHHALRVLLTGEREGYFAGFRGTVAELDHAITGGFIYQGEVEPTTGQPRGTKVTTEPASAFVFCTENHDQVGNRAFGERLNHLISAERYAVATALFLFAPETPLLFMGQEFAASTPFLFFTDHNDELGKLVVAGRREEFKGFRAFADPQERERIPNPQAEATFLGSKLDLSERKTNRGIYRLYRDLIRLRHDDAVLRDPSRARTSVVQLGDRVFAVRRWNETGERLLIANFSSDPISLTKDNELVGGGGERAAKVILATTWRRYGGNGIQFGWRGRDAARRFEVPPASAIILAGPANRDGA
ncbi:MAG: malto-oligosyltrehalose trehalohydrolase [Chloroflexota bacterium]|nr:malto-oligosyltrehalose trehalohydrolase [Chloroflexota bacterium]